jgi:thioredoxin reductase (NADPH)
MESFDISFAKSLQKADSVWDVIIIGAGPAGLSAALYAARARLRTLVLDKGAVPGGQIAATGTVEDYPGVGSISGEGLGKSMGKAAESFGAVIRMAEPVSAIRDKGKSKEVETPKAAYTAKAVIFASGAAYRRLNVPGEDRFFGKGVSFCAVCDAPFFKGKHVAVVGGGNSAVEEAIYLTKFAEKVTLIHRRDALKADKVIQERAFANPKMSFIWNSEAVEILGNERLAGIRLKDSKTGKASDFACDGVFVYVGMEPNSSLLKGLADLDKNGYILANERMETKTPGIYAAGDVRSSPFKQAITAAAEGAIAGHEAGKYIEALH